MRSGKRSWLETSKTVNSCVWQKASSTSSLLLIKVSVINRTFADVASRSSNFRRTICVESSLPLPSRARSAFSRHFIAVVLPAPSATKQSTAAVGLDLQTQVMNRFSPTVRIAEIFNVNRGIEVLIRSPSFCHPLLPCSGRSVREIPYAIPSISSIRSSQRTSLRSLD